MASGLKNIVTAEDIYPKSQFTHRKRLSDRGDASQMKQVFGFSFGQCRPAGSPVSDIETVDSYPFGDASQIFIRFFGQGRAPDRISVGQQFLGQPGAGKAANTGYIGLNFSAPPAA
jgi:hypothetical protein